MLTAITLENMHAFLTHAVSSGLPHAQCPFQTEMSDKPTDNQIAVLHNVPIQVLSILSLDLYF